MTIYDLLRSSVVQIRSDAVSPPSDAVRCGSHTENIWAIT